MKIYLLILCNIIMLHHSLVCMKRSNPFADKQITKKASTKQPFVATPLRNFFISNTQLRQVCTASKKNILAYRILPEEIKEIIASHSFTYPTEWWYKKNQRRYDSYGSSAHAVCFYDEKKLAIGLYPNIIKIINPETNEQISHIITDQEVRSLAIDQKKQTLYYGSLNGSIKKINLNNTTEIVPFLYAENNTVWAISFNNDNSQFAYAQDNKQITIINSNTGKTIHTIRTKDIPYAVSFSKSCNQLRFNRKNFLYTTSINQPDQPTQIALPIFYGQEKTLYAASHSQAHIAIADGHYLHLLDNNSLDTISHITFSSSIYSLSFSPNNQQLAVGLKNGTVHLLEQYKNYTLRQLFLHKLIYLWLQVQKPYKSVETPEYLLSLIAYRLHLDHVELNAVWQTFPTQMRTNLWSHLLMFICKYGKAKLFIQLFYKRNNNLHNIFISYNPHQTYEQYILRKIIEFWKIKTPLLHHVFDPTSLLRTIGVVFNLCHVELTDIWNTLNVIEQDDIWHSIENRLQ